MPRAQRTKSAVHEALQRRAGQRPGASFSVKLDAPPHLWLPPYRFHTVVFRSRHVIKHTRASHPHRFGRRRPHKISPRALRNALLCPWCSADDEIACRSPGGDACGDQPEPIAKGAHRRSSAGACPTALRCVTTATDPSFRAATERRPQLGLTLNVLPARTGV
jgi:hypothetical protein